MILGVHHDQITIPIGEEDTARAFYCSLLGVTEIEKPEALAGRGGFWLEVDGFAVHVGTEGDSAPALPAIRTSGPVRQSSGILAEGRLFAEALKGIEER